MGGMTRPASPTIPPPGPRLSRRDLLALIALVVVIIAAWTRGTGLDRWSTPLAYAESAEQADVVFHLALVKAAIDGDALPLRWKSIHGLGAPAEANWNDWPIVEEVPTAVMALAGRLFGLAAGYNLVLAGAAALAGCTFYGVARAAGGTIGWSFAGGLAFGLAPFTFAQTPHHPFIALVWHVPLFLPIWRWVTTEPGLAWGGRPFWFAVAVGFVTGLQSPYYTNIFCQVTLLGAAVHYARTRSRGPAAAAGVVVAAAAAGFALMNLDTWTYRLAHGPNPGALVREYKWLEIYGLKLVDLVVPPVTHAFEPWAAFARAHRSAAPLQDEGSSLGIVGVAALLLLVAVAVAAIVRRRLDEVPLEAWQSLWLVLTFGTGGLNTILGALGFTLFRTGCRASIVILALVLAHAVRWLSDRQRAVEARAAGAGMPPETTRIGVLTAVALACAVIVFDQVPRPPARDRTATIARQFAADRAFVTALEQALPPDAAIFQVPVMAFPEAPLPGVPAYDHLRPFLHGSRLRWSFGTTKGRADDRWQAGVQDRLVAGAVVDQQAGRIRFDPAAVRQAIDELQQRGFAALCINARGFVDGGRGLAAAVQQITGARPVASTTGDLICIPFADRPAATE